MPAHVSSASRSLRHPPPKRTHKEREDPCPFCEISATYPLTRGQSTSSVASTRSSRPSEKRKRELRSTTHLILSTPQVLAFLDIMPLSPGHILLTSRRHAKKIMDLSPEEGASLGAWLPILTRAVSRAMGVDDLNVVQNNGERASQVVPHVHYHIIPRPSTYNPNRSWTMFGKGPREDLDDEEGELNAARIRQEIGWELESLGHSDESLVVKTKLQAPQMPPPNLGNSPGPPTQVLSQRRYGPKL